MQREAETGSPGTLSRHRFLKAAVVGGGALTAGGLLLRSLWVGRPERRPNIVLIMADDLGAECLGCYGSESYETPNLDELARSGLRFENVYSTPLCTPTRVQIMTGQYPFRTGWKLFILHSPRSDQVVDPSLPNFARLLGSVGYATAVAGKWQLCRFDERPNHAREFGFDEHCLWMWQYGDRSRNRYWNPWIWQNGRRLRKLAGQFGPDVYCDYLIDFMRRNRARPFFAYYPMCLPHRPFVATPGDPAGLRPERERNFPGMVGYLDALVGRIVKALDELGVRERTLLLFTGDNGSPPKIRSRLNGRTVERGKGQLSEAGCRVPLVASWPGTAAEGEVVDDPVDLSDMLPTFAELAGAPLPEGVTIDGRSFAPRLRGEAGSPREWAYSQLGDDWFVRDRRWRLRSSGELDDMTDRYAPVPAPSSAEAVAAERRLRAAVGTLRAS